MNRERTGISNRETPAEEEKERREHPPEVTGSPEPQDAAGRVAETPTDEVPVRRGMPATQKKPGAFGAEPREVAADEGPDRDEP